MYNGRGRYVRDLFGGFELELRGVFVAELFEDVAELAVDFLGGNAEEIELEVA